jgi:endonuclease/exonuclease/phosphatase (EEP) superfamily protein YafD
MRIFTLILCAIVIIATGLPLINSAAWWIRIFDFPRLQIAVLILLAIILAFFFVDFKWEFKLPLLVILAISLAYQVQYVVVYMPFYKTQAKDSNKPFAENSFTLLVSNVRMENDEKERFHAFVKKHNPDILLITEPDL